MGYEESTIAESRPYQGYTDRLEKALATINNKTKSFQVNLEKCEKTPSAQTEFEDRLRALVEKAEDLSAKIKF